MSDVNDNVPKFELPDYQAHNVREDIAIGTPILKVNILLIFLLIWKKSSIFLVNNLPIWNQYLNLTFL